MLGVAPHLGRVFHEGDGRDGAIHFVIVSERFWQQRLARDLSAVGRTITIDGERVEIVGVMPAAFRYPNESQDLWLPLDVTQPPASALRGRTNLTVIARIRGDLSRADVESRVAARGEAVYRASGGSDESGARVVTLGELFNDRTARSLWVLGGAVVFLLLIVCANVANLTLARSLARTRDLAVRAALGASRGALFRVTLLEHALIGAAGAVLGLAVAQLAMASVIGVLPEEMTQASLNAIDLDWRTLAFLAGCSIGTILVFGLPPAIVASRATVAAALGRESRASTGSPAARRFRAALVVLEVAFSIVLLVGAALMTRSLLKLQSIDVGMDPQNLLALRVGFPQRGFEDARGIDLVTADIVRRLAATPGVQHASAGSLPPNDSMITVGAIEVGDRPGERAGTRKSLTRVYETWPGYFAAVGIPLIEGREPVERDVDGAVVVSREFAVKHWPGRSAIGARFRVGEYPWRTVVGVSAELRRLGETPESAQLEIFYPHDQVSGVMHAAERASAVKLYRTFVVRTSEPGALARRLGDVVHEADPRVILTSTTRVAHQFADLIARPRIVFLMLAIFAGAGLLLAAAGLYAVLAHLVTQRLREIGVRLAIGARPADVARLVLRSGALLTGAGLVVGLAGAAALVGVMRTLLYEVDPVDPLAMGLAVTLLAGTALVASLVPARRAMRVDPVRLLRES
jgi:predicted permease